MSTAIRFPRIAGALLLGGALLAQAPSVPALRGTTRAENRVERLAYGGRLRVQNRNGSIRVQGWDREEVALAAAIRDSERRRVELVLQRQGADLDIEARFQQRGWSFGFGAVRSPRCEMALSVPRRLLAFFRTTNGAVTVARVNGYARCETTNGDIQVREVAGEVHVDTINGNVELEDLKARVKGGTTNGQIRVEGVEGGLDLETTNGRILARNLDGWGEGIRMETTNGSIDVELGRASGELRAENTVGSLEVHVPGAQLMELGKHSVRLRIPGRSQRIHLETTTGSIRIH